MSASDDVAFSDADQQLVTELGAACRQITSELGKVIIGQQQVVEQLLLSLLAGGHCVLVGVPGLAKTLMCQSLAATLNLKYSRVQFTPDQMPADITGTEVIQENRSTGEREFRFMPGPIFTNLLLADEINRTPPKTQAALLEAMAERQVSAGGTRHQLPSPFFVLATQNPIEQEGTYPLPEAQLDRFLLQILVDYPTEDEEFLIVRRTTAAPPAPLEPVLSADDVLSLQELVRRIPVADHVIRYAMSIVRSTRVNAGEVPEFIREYVRWGAGPRASQALVLAAKARAVLHSRSAASVEDVQAIAAPVLRHRVLTNFNAEAEGVTTDDLVAKLLETLSADPSGDALRDRLPNVFGSANPR